MHFDPEKSCSKQDQTIRELREEFPKMTTNRWIPLSMIYVVVLFFSVGVYSAVNRLVSSSIGSSLGPVSPMRPGWPMCDGGCIRARSSFSDSVPSGAKQTHDHDPPLESLNVELTFYMYAGVHVCENDAMLNMGIRVCVEKNYT